MTSKPSASSRLRKAARNMPGFNEAIKTLLRAQQGQGHAADRALAIMGGSMVEDALRVAIKRKFDPSFRDDLLPELFDYERKGPLSTLGYRILVGFALGVYGPMTYRDLKRINVIRNAFAHSPEEIGFDTPAVKDLCTELELIRLSKPNALNVLATEPRDEKDAYAKTASLLVSRFRIAVKSENIRWTPVPLP